MAQNAWRARIALPALIAALSVGSVLAAQQVLSPAPGDTFTVNCGQVPLVNATVTTSTITGACATPIPTAGQPCPQALHDGITTTGPDGRLYPTWHPPVDPQSGCLFGHEHGADPRTSAANAMMPPFGYAAAVMGMVEPHEGFKVFVLNAGETVESNVPNKIADEDDRVVFHMGTSGVGRYTQQFHSMQFDYVDRSGTGNYAHLYGLADTGTTAQDGSVCGPRFNAKDFSTVGCAGTYEIWTAQLRLEHPADPYQGAYLSRFASGLSFAVFDPISTRDPADNTRLLYTEALIDFATHYKQPYWGYRPNPDPTSPAAFYQGCRREHYGGPTYFHNAGQSTVYWTDPYGHINPAGEDAMHPIRQQLSATSGHKETNFKARRDYCGNGIRTPNQMSDWPIDLSSMQSIHIGSPESNICGIIANQAPVSATFSANRGLFVPFTLTRPVRVRKMWCINGTAVSGNLDVGIYDYALNKVVTSGSTAQAGISSLQLVTIAATDLYPGLYFWAFAFDNAVATNMHPPTLDISVARILGVGQQVSAFPLPATIVPIATSGTVPNMGMMTGRIV